MEKEFSNKWKSSKQARKQRKYTYNAPLHIRKQFMRSHLSAELKKTYTTRSFGLRKGDKVKLVRGQFKGRDGKIDKVDLKRGRVYITGIELPKKDGSKMLYPIHPSNLIITELALDDKYRREKIKQHERK